MAPRRIGGRRVRVDESVPSQQGLKLGVGVEGREVVARVDESVPSQQGLKLGVGVEGAEVVARSMSPFHHNKD